MAQIVLHLFPYFPIIVTGTFATIINIFKI